MFGRKGRVRRYVHELEQTDLIAADSKRIVTKLAKLWKLLKISDFKDMSDKHLASIGVAVWCKNLPMLTERFQQFNGYIANSEDGLLEQYRNVWFIEKQVVVMDLYFSDDKHYPIDTLHYLTRLKGLIQQHDFVTKQHDSGYYKRISEPFYEEIIDLTEFLINYAEDHFM